MITLLMLASFPCRPPSTSAFVSLIPSLHSQLFFACCKTCEKKLGVETGNEAKLLSLCTIFSHDAKKAMGRSLGARMPQCNVSCAFIAYCRFSNLCNANSEQQKCGSLWNSLIWTPLGLRWIIYLSPGCYSITSGSVYVLRQSEIEPLGLINGGYNLFIS